MPAFWCVHFDAEERVLEHGFQESLWLMQYQYSHGGHAYQGGRKQITAASKNWNALREIKPGDWLVAYLRSKRFFAIGKAIEPRSRERHHGQPHREDTVERTVKEHAHRFLSGVVRYADAPAFYEDFTDSWSRRVTNDFSHQPEVWRYPQRIDVDGWREVVRSGVEVKGLADAVPRPQIRLAAFQIPKPLFETIKLQLQAEYHSAEEIEAETHFKEGAVKQVRVNAYERNAEARKAGIAHYGRKCAVCRFDFGERYGELGEGFIHVHHLRELATIAQQYGVNPIEDLRPVCPNCHAMLHRKVPAMSIEELKAVVYG